ncbi:MAG TPA: phage holin family protein [Actinomycetota bacterium]|nr:phage holin family protein [Actinomycetota bacterium]
MSIDNSKIERSVPELVSDVAKDISTLVRKELELAKIETKEEISRGAKAGGMIGGAGGAAYFALLLLSFGIVFLLDLAMPLWLSFVVVAAVYGVVAAVLFIQGRTRMKEINPVPEETVESVKEDVRWLKAQNR